LDKLSGTPGIITNIVEEWEDETGPIYISYHLNGESKFANPEYGDDWIDQTFIENTLAEISKITNESFYLCLGPNEEWAGQDVNYIRFTKQERQILEEKLHWSFLMTFLKE
jgi:hypothetical protein